ncbi:MAG: hypothetical protein ACXVPQ_05870, partial [Bacteroidia bacterium]
MTMKLMFFSVLVLMCLSFCAPKVYDRLSWQQKEVTVDGNASEWPMPLKYFDSKSKLNFTITNDRVNLYICVRAADDASQAKILRSGMEIALDTSAKKTFPFSVVYPLPRGDRAKKFKKEDRQDQSDVSKKEALIQGLKEMKLNGFLITETDLVSTNSPYGIKAGLEVDKSDVMIYELVIPFKTFYKEQLTPSDTNKVFNYRIKVMGIAFEGGGGSGGNGGGGGRHGGGMGGGGMGGGGMGGGGMG